MTTDDDGPENPTDDASNLPVIEVEVSRDTAQKALRMARKNNLAIEDALARLTVFDYPTDVLHTPAEEPQPSEGR